MIDANIVAKRVLPAYQVTAKLGFRTILLKYDTGAKYSVISVGMFDDTLTDDDLIRIKEYCEEHSSCKERFISASGHTFDGYLVVASNVKIGNTYIREFRYHLVIENQRDIALLGFDFIENCKGLFEPQNNIIITAFDEKHYGTLDAGSMNSEDVIAFVHSLSSDHSL